MKVLAFFTGVIDTHQKLVKRMVDNGYIARHENGTWRVIATSVV